MARATALPSLGRIAPRYARTCSSRTMAGPAFLRETGRTFWTYFQNEHGDSANDLRGRLRSRGGTIAGKRAGPGRAAVTVQPLSPTGFYPLHVGSRPLDLSHNFSI